MRLYSGKVQTIAEDLIRELTRSNDIDVEEEAEARLDVEAVLKEYVRYDRQITDEAKTRMEAGRIGYGNLGRIKNEVAKEHRGPAPDEALPYLLEQILNMLFHSKNIAEVYASDADLRKKITGILRKHMSVDHELDQEVRAKIKNLEEGTSSFEIEYTRVMAEMKRKRGLTE